MNSPLSEDKILNKRILIVDDNESIHEDFKSILLPSENESSDIGDLESELFSDEEASIETIKVDYEIDDAYQGDQAVEMVRKSQEEKRPYGLIFMDVRMPPGISGIEAINKIWDMYPFVEIVICTAYSDYSWDKIITQVGTTDKLLFVQKPFNVVEVKQMTLSLIKKWNINNHLENLINNLESEVNQRTKQLKDVLSKLETKNKELEELSQKDSMTGLLNHKTIHERLKSLINESNRHEIPLCIFIIDIDKFKLVNDEHGHLKGDEVIKHLSSILRDNLRNYDVAGRYGGDEFMLITPHCPMDKSDVIAGRIFAGIQEAGSEIELEYSVSIGVSFIDAETICLNPPEVVACADKALYEAKLSEGNKLVVSRYHAEQ